MFGSKIAALLAAVLMAAQPATAYSDTNGGQHPIVGTWELVMMVGVSDEEFAMLFSDVVETFYADGSGLSIMGDTQEPFIWSTNDGRLLMVGENWYYDGYYLISDSGTTLVFSSDVSEYPDGMWIMKRAD